MALFALLLALAPVDRPAPEAEIVAALSQDTVEIRSDFAGADLIVIGAARGVRPGDEIVVVARGPAADVRVMRKAQIAGIWVNQDPVRFEDVAGYYAAASTRPLETFTTLTARRRFGIGLADLRLSAPETERLETIGGVANVRVSDLGAEIIRYRDALVRQRMREGLYTESPGAVERLEGGLFRARFRLPPTTPVGIYRAETYLFRDGAPIAARTTTLEVRKAGLGRTVYDLAHERPMLYGALAVAFGVLAGWLAAQAFRRR